ncbi:hypothetical protein Kpol_1033p25 [Vanderwaltozyma polyspora DSM 70294]|uniref:RNA exonuclease 3 n=1 Tax=Vanderwaltozyma polyspora (strain ATCC 22028 / DSM 70294 / BCRC 21397 / CBS 2163 / NBRC 10782 / NRRL Y-8283 / UCD 57-17) TaxID=436907 RepID=A7TJ21_VANPO|nr:uncharacterized protein Kpol_1033p25 [Vanderwaltozyma polyspora DSM 70294]EDO17720.1 hypothetical protein Kpol_1033p25 [Vanderwaltozyma polyspora DSM 70294]
MNNHNESTSLRPQEMVRQPIGYVDRYKVVKKLFGLFKKYMPSNSSGLEALSVQIEGFIAKSSVTSQSYRFNASIVLRDLLKSKCDLSKIKVSNKTLHGIVNEKFLSSSLVKQDILITKEEVVLKLNELLHDVTELEKNGYIIDHIAKHDSEISDFISCTRCNTKFSKKNIMESTVCKYHPLKRVFSKTGSNQYPCCGETTDSTSNLRLGCKQSTNHVYRGEGINELSRITKFVNTRNIDGHNNVLALDCEMAFTSLGYEMIRLTIVDFFSLQTLFDEIIQPIGDIIDLNTQFSGVHGIDRNTALTYQAAIGRVLCNQLINKNSILIGHGLENDLNVLRIVHHKVIDTAIIYSKGKFKPSLKNLVFEHIDRKIQTGEHDSSEDAIGSMDVIKKKLGIPLNKKNW